MKADLLKECAVVVAACAVFAAPAFAHHSMAMFEFQKRVLLVGTVKEVQWTNPHGWLQLMVPMPNGTELEWSVEMEGPNGMMRIGWKRNTVKPGDEVKVLVRPLRDGRPGGGLINITLPDGTKLGRSVDEKGEPLEPNATMAEVLK